LKTNTSDDEVDSSLSSVETDVDLLLQDVIEKAANQTDDEPLEGQWKFLSQSRRGGEMAGNLKSGVFDDTLKVSYDSVNEVLKDKMLVEVRHSLEQVRKKLKMQNRTPIDAAAAFAGALPFELLHIMKKWLMDTDSAEGREVTFDDMVEFLRCEIVLRLFGVSSSELSAFDMGDDTVAKYDKVRKAVSLADLPASKKSKDNTVGAGHVAKTMDPLLVEAVEVLNKEWVGIFFVIGVSWLDIDDDKLNFCSNLWKAYGFKMTPTKDKKLKPVIHITATTGSGHICHLTPDKLGLKLADMLKTTIEVLCPNEQLRQELTFFIDRGYMELAKAQKVKVTNLIQVMETLKVKFLGTVKESASFPFYHVDVNEDGMKERGSRMVTQMYGQRSTFIAKKGSIQASSMRQGGGKVRAGRLATNQPRAMANEWVMETSNGDATRRIPHASPPESIASNASLDRQAEYHFRLFESCVYVYTREQRTQDWFLLRKFLFSSTSAHAVFNLKAAEFFNTPRLNRLHEEVKQTVRLNPTKVVGLDNVDEHEDEYLPSQATRLHARLPSNQNVHSNCTASFWKGRKLKRDGYIKLLDDLGIDHPDSSDNSFKIKNCCEMLAKYYTDKAKERADSYQDQDIGDDDEQAQKQASICLLSLMTRQPAHAPLTAHSR